MGARPQRRSRARFRIAGLVASAAAGAALFGASPAQAERAPTVRVLLLESGEPVELASPRQRHRIALAAGRSALVVDGARVGTRWAPSGDGPWQVGTRRYRGALELTSAPGRIRVVNRIGLEDYVVATVGGEMPASWPVEALRAQAVATRTYALYQRERSGAEPFDLRATEQSQVYRGIEAESATTRRAAADTRGQILTHAGRPILAAFHSTAGGRTASAAEVWGRGLPYLGSIEVDHEEEAPFTYWRTVFPADTVAGALASLGFEPGRLERIEIAARTESGRVARLIAEGGARRLEVAGDRLRSLVERLGLRSTLFDVRETPQGFAFVGSGYGHGVGMSQWGAREWARRGASYQRILARFYPGARLEAGRSEHVASRSAPGD